MQTALEEISKRPPQRTAQEREMKGREKERKKRTPTNKCRARVKPSKNPRNPGGGLQGDG